MVTESNLKPSAPFMDASEIVDDLYDDEGNNDTNWRSKDFNAAINGYKTKLDNTSNVVVLALDSATQKALNNIFKMPSSNYLENTVLASQLLLDT